MIWDSFKNKDFHSVKINPRYLSLHLVIFVIAAISFADVNFTIDRSCFTYVTGTPATKSAVRVASEPENEPR